MFIPPWREALARLSAVPETKIPRIAAGLDACCCSARAQSFPSPGWLWHLAGGRRLPGGQRASALAPLLISTSMVPDLLVAALNAQARDLGNCGSKTARQTSQNSHQVQRLSVCSGSFDLTCRARNFPSG